MSLLADSFSPPYYAVIFSSIQEENLDGYGKTAARMMELAATQPGFLGVESARERIGITVSYWTDLDSIKAWRTNVEHTEARRLGREKWYRAYRLRVAKVERDYGNER